MDHQGSIQAQGEVWVNICRPQEQWPWKGPQFHHPSGASSHAEKVQHSLAALLPLTAFMFVNFIPTKPFRTLKKKKERKKKKKQKKNTPARRLHLLV